jgi:ubiquitin-protein ligase
MRTRRLMADAKEMAAAFGEGFEIIRVRATTGEPAEVYQIEYRVRGLERGKKGPVMRDHHLVEIQLTAEYPRLGPKCRMLTPVFHPNIDPATICVGDHWTAGEKLADLVVRIGEMLAYQDYNIKSPLDAEAAMWADLNAGELPTDGRNLRPPRMEE